MGINVVKNDEMLKDIKDSNGIGKYALSLFQPKVYRSLKKILQSIKMTPPQNSAVLSPSFSKIRFNRVFFSQHISEEIKEFMRHTFDKSVCLHCTILYPGGGVWVG